MSKHPRFREKVYKMHFTPEKADWLLKNCKKLNDRRSAIQLGIPIRIVAGYRVDVLKIGKQCSVRSSLNHLNDKVLAKEELEALEAFNYCGLMRESVDHRIKILQDILG